MKLEWFQPDIDDISTSAIDNCESGLQVLKFAVTSYTIIFFFILTVEDDRKERKERIERALIRDKSELHSIFEGQNVARNEIYTQVNTESENKNEPVDTRVTSERTTQNFDFDMDKLKSSRETSQITRPTTILYQRSHETSKQNKNIQITDLMQQQIIKQMNSLLSDVKTHKKEDDEQADCGLWDFAGERDYYATHQTFMTNHAIYVIVTDVSKDIKDIIPDTEFDTVGVPSLLSTAVADVVADIFYKESLYTTSVIAVNSKLGIDKYIDFWFDSIHCFCSTYSHDRLDPPVILVCTGADKVNLTYRELNKVFFLQDASDKTFSLWPDGTGCVLVLPALPNGLPFSMVKLPIGTRTVMTICLFPIITFEGFNTVARI